MNIDRRGTWIAAFVFVGVLLASAVVVVDAVVTYDSGEYLAHSRDLTGLGLVQLGYRQVGYPLVLWFGRVVASPFGGDGLQVVALLQRLLLVAAATYGALVLRWFAVPLLALALLPGSFVYTNLILTEGVGLGLAVLFAVVLVHALQRLRTDRRDSVTFGLFAAGVALLCVLAVIRFHLIVLTPAVAVVFFAMYRDPGTAGRRPMVAVGAAGILLLGGFLIGATVENAREYDIARPSVRGEGPTYWATWRIVFTITDPHLASQLPDLYADGEEYALIVETRHLPPEEERRRLSEATTTLRDASALSITEHRIRSMWGTLRGGRFDDIAFLVSGIASARISALASLPSAGTILSVLLPACLVCFTFGLAVREVRPVSLAGLIPLLGLMLGTGYLMLDNVRFLIVPAVAIVALGCGCAQALWETRRHADLSRSDTASLGSAG